MNQCFPFTSMSINYCNGKYWESGNIYYVLTEIVIIVYYIELNFVLFKYENRIPLYFFHMSFSRVQNLNLT